MNHRVVGSGSVVAEAMALRGATIVAESGADRLTAVMEIAAVDAGAGNDLPQLDGCSTDLAIEWLDDGAIRGTDYALTDLVVRGVERLALADGEFTAGV